MPRAKKEDKPEVIVELEKIIKESFNVIANDGGVIRTYSEEIHGPEAEKLANQYAGKIGASVR